MHLQYKRHPTALEIDKRRQKFIPTFVDDDDDDVAADVTHDGVIREVRLKVGKFFTTRTAQQCETFKQQVPWLIHLLLLIVL